MQDGRGLSLCMPSLRPTASPTHSSISSLIVASNSNYGKAVATQAHPKHEDTIIAVQQPVKPLRALSTHRKGTVRRMPTLRENGTGEQDRDDDDLITTGTPCVAGEFRSALDTLFNILGETQNWYEFCIKLSTRMIRSCPTSSRGVLSRARFVVSV